MEIQAANTTCVDENFIKMEELSVKQDGPTSTITAKYEVVKEYPIDLMVSTVQTVH
jgi:hypothetical protein